MQTDPGGIECDRVYTLKLFMKLAGLSRPAMAAARRNGCPVRFIGGKAYVSGREFMAWLEDQPTLSPAVSKLIGK